MKINYYSIKLIICICCCICFHSLTFAQTNPTPQTLPYSQNFSSLLSTSTVYPAGWQGWSIPTATATVFNTGAPIGDFALQASSTAANVTPGVHNYNGLIGYLAEGNTTAYTFNAAICLALVTTGYNSVLVNYSMSTMRNPYNVSTNNRINQVDLQYRIGTVGSFTSVANANALYINNTTSQLAGTTPQNVISKSIQLPAACNNQPIVQIRWVQRDNSGTIGALRPSFSVDNISICPSQTIPTVSISGPSGSCSGNSATYVASFTNGGTTPTFQWKKNGVNVGTDSVITLSGLVVNDQIQCTMVSGFSCSAPAISNIITITSSNSSPTISSAVVTGSCVGLNNGSINLTVTGGTPPYTICWDTVNKANGPMFGVLIGNKTAAGPLFPFPGFPQVYFIDGVESKELFLMKGLTYQFSVNTAGHPFHISKDNIGGSSAGLILNGQTGAPTQSGTVSFTPSNANPSLLYYPCAVHQYMGWKINVVNGHCVEDPTNLMPGKYSVVVTDANGCKTFSPTAYTVGTRSATTEICNSIDDDCDGLTDDADPSVTGRPTWYVDGDGDGFGAGAGILACTQPVGRVNNNTDCNDANPLIKPGAVEVCNGIDDDCDALTDDNDPGVTGRPTWYLDGDGDGFGAGAGILACNQPVGRVNNNSDCNDGNPAIKPGATEICNTIDDNCNTLIDDNDPGVTGRTLWYTDGDNDTYGSLADPGTLACFQPVNKVADHTDCNDGNVAIHPNATEICNGVDDDCDLLTDDSDPQITGQSLWYLDGDNDTYGSNNDPGTVACFQPVNRVADHTDCNDGNAVVHPNALETCNGDDDDCDGFIDDSDPNVSGQQSWYTDSDNDGYGSQLDPGTSLCNQPPGKVNNNTDCDDASGAVHPNVVEICNNIDDNCNTFIDDSDPGVTGQSTWYTDGDNDTYGNSNDPGTLACFQPGSKVVDHTDCDDAIGSIHPNATEDPLNNVDDDCDNLIDESTTILNLKLFIEGFYSGGGLMDNSGLGGCLYYTGNSINTADADSIIVTLVDPGNLLDVYSKKAILQTNGTVDITFVIERSKGNLFYLKINHRSSIETWSANPVMMSGSTPYDFSLSPGQAYGNNQIQLFDASGYAIYGGDISDSNFGVGFQDRIIESQDYSDMENAVSITLLGYKVEDITGDGIVESADYGLMENNVYFTRVTMRP